MIEDIQELGSRIDRIEVTLTHAVDAIDKIAAVVTRSKETRWGPILTALAIALAAMTGYTTLVLSPVERDILHTREEVGSMMIRELERERDIGRLEGLMMIEDDDG